MSSASRWKCSIELSLVSTTSMSLAWLNIASICRIAVSVGPRSPRAIRSRTRSAAISTGHTTRSVVTLAPLLLAMSRNRLRWSSALNDPTAITSLPVARAAVTAAPIAEYACTIASLVRSPADVRPAAPSSSANVSDAKLTASHRSTIRWANVDFPAPGTPQTIMRCRASMTGSSKSIRRFNQLTGIW